MKIKTFLFFVLLFLMIGGSSRSFAQTAPAPQIDAQTLDSYLGEYQLTNDVILSIGREGEKLVVSSGQVKSELIAEVFTCSFAIPFVSDFAFDRK